MTKMDGRYEVLRAVHRFEGLQTLEVVDSDGDGWRLRAFSGSARLAPTEIARFLREGETLGRVRSSHVEHASHHGTAPFPYSVTPWREAVTLRELLEGTEARALSRELVLVVGIDLARAVEDLHVAGECAGALCPDAVLIDEHGRARIADLPLLRLVRRLEENGDAESQRAIRYASPEGRCFAEDLWALGAVLYESATGQPMLDGDAAIAIRTPQLGSLIEMLTRHEPTARPGATDLREVLEATELDSRRARSALGALVTSCLEESAPTLRDELDHFALMPPGRTDTVLLPNPTLRSDPGTLPAPLRVTRTVAMVPRDAVARRGGASQESRLPVIVGLGMFATICTVGAALLVFSVAG